MTSEVVVLWSITQTARYLDVPGAAKLHAADPDRDTRTLCGIDAVWNTAGSIWEGDGRTRDDGQAWANCKRCLKIMDNCMTATRTPKEQTK